MLSPTLVSDQDIETRKEWCKLCTLISHLRRWTGWGGGLTPSYYGRIFSSTCLGHNCSSNAFVNLVCSSLARQAGKKLINSTCYFALIAFAPFAWFTKKPLVQNYIRLHAFSLNCLIACNFTQSSMFCFIHRCLVIMKPLNHSGWEISWTRNPIFLMGTIQQQLKTQECLHHIWQLAIPWILSARIYYSVCSTTT